MRSFSSSSPLRRLNSRGRWTSLIYSELVPNDRLSHQSRNVFIGSNFQTRTIKFSSKPNNQDYLILMGEKITMLSTESPSYVLDLMEDFLPECTNDTLLDDYGSLLVLGLFYQAIKHTLSHSSEAADITQLLRVLELYSEFIESCQSRFSWYLKSSDVFVDAYDVTARNFILLSRSEVFKDIRKMEFFSKMNVVDGILRFLKTMPLFLASPEDMNISHVRFASLSRIIADLYLEESLSSSEVDTYIRNCVFQLEGGNTITVLNPVGDANSARNIRAYSAIASSCMHVIAQELMRSDISESRAYELNKCFDRATYFALRRVSPMVLDVLRRLDASASASVLNPHEPLSEQLRQTELRARSVLFDAELKPVLSPSLSLLEPLLIFDLAKVALIISALRPHAYVRAGVRGSAECTAIYAEPFPGAISLPDIYSDSGRNLKDHHDVEWNAKRAESDEMDRLAKLQHWQLLRALGALTVAKPNFARLFPALVEIQHTQRTVVANGNDSAFPRIVNLDELESGSSPETFASLSCSITKLFSCLEPLMPARTLADYVYAWGPVVSHLGVTSGSTESISIHDLLLSPKSIDVLGGAAPASPLNSHSPYIPSASSVGENLIDLPPIISAVFPLLIEKLGTRIEHQQQSHLGTATAALLDLAVRVHSQQRDGNLQPATWAAFVKDWSTLPSWEENNAPPPLPPAAITNLWAARAVADKEGRDAYGDPPGAADVAMPFSLSVAIDGVNSGRGAGRDAWSDAMAPRIGLIDRDSLVTRNSQQLKQQLQEEQKRTTFLAESTAKRHPGLDRAFISKSLLDEALELATPWEDSHLSSTKKNTEVRDIRGIQIQNLKESRKSGGYAVPNYLMRNSELENKAIPKVDDTDAVENNVSEYEEFDAPLPPIRQAGSGDPAVFVALRARFLDLRCASPSNLHPWSITERRIDLEAVLNSVRYFDNFRDQLSRLSRPLSINLTAPGRPLTFIQESTSGLANESMESSSSATLPVISSIFGSAGFFGYGSPRAVLRRHATVCVPAEPQGDIQGGLERNLYFHSPTFTSHLRSLENPFRLLRLKLLKRSPAHSRASASRFIGTNSTSSPVHELHNLLTLPLLLAQSPSELLEGMYRHPHFQGSTFERTARRRTRARLAPPAAGALMQQVVPLMRIHGTGGLNSEGHLPPIIHLNMDQLESHLNISKSQVDSESPPSKVEIFTGVSEMVIPSDTVPGTVMGAALAASASTLFGSLSRLISTQAAAGETLIWEEIGVARTLLRAGTPKSPLSKAILRRLAARQLASRGDALKGPFSGGIGSGPAAELLWLLLLHGEVNPDVFAGLFEIVENDWHNIRADLIRFDHAHPKKDLFVKEGRSLAQNLEKNDSFEKQVASRSTLFSSLWAMWRRTLSLLGLSHYQDRLYHAWGLLPPEPPVPSLIEARNLMSVPATPVPTASVAVYVAMALHELDGTLAPLGDAVLSLALRDGLVPYKLPTSLKSLRINEYEPWGNGIVSPTISGSKSSQQFSHSSTSEKYPESKESSIFDVKDNLIRLLSFHSLEGDSHQSLNKKPTIDTPRVNIRVAFIADPTLPATIDSIRANDTVERIINAIDSTLPLDPLVSSSLPLGQAFSNGRDILIDRIKAVAADATLVSWYRCDEGRLIIPLAVPKKKVAFEFFSSTGFLARGSTGADNYAVTAVNSEGILDPNAPFAEPTSYTLWRHSKLSKAGWTIYPIYVDCWTNSHKITNVDTYLLY